MIIAEIGQNHMGNMGLARTLIDEAKEQGADIAKFQLYNSVALYGEHQEQELTRWQVSQLAKHCRDVGIEFMCSVFDIERIQWCEEVGVKRYKIASRSVGDDNLIKAVLATGKPVIMSIPYGQKFHSIAAKYAGYSMNYLYCIPEYPTKLERLHLVNVPFYPYTQFAKLQPHYFGLSDHTEGIIASKIALARGALAIEKHFRLNDNLVGPDYPHSITPSQLGELVRFAHIMDVVL